MCIIYINHIRVCMNTVKRTPFSRLIICVYHIFNDLKSKKCMTIHFDYL